MAEVSSAVIGLPPDGVQLRTVPLRGQEAGACTHYSCPLLIGDYSWGHRLCGSLGNPIDGQRMSLTIQEMQAAIGICETACL